MTDSTDALRRVRRLLVVVLGGLGAAGAAGCSRAPEIRTYTAPKQNAGDAAAQLRRSAPARPSLAYETPEGWRPGRAEGMRKAAFNVSDNGRAVEVTVIDLAAAAGALLPNVNRWRNQIQLPNITQEELEASAREIPVAGVTGSYVELIGPPEANPREAILGVVAVRGGKAWFIKLMGDAELAQREKERFEAFVKSLRFDATDGASDGQ